METCKKELTYFEVLNAKLLAQCVWPMAAIMPASDVLDTAMHSSKSGELISLGQQLSCNKELYGTCTMKVEPSICMPVCFASEAPTYEQEVMHREALKLSTSGVVVQYTGPGSICQGKAVVKYNPYIGSCDVLPVCPATAEAKVVNAIQATPASSATPANCYDNFDSATFMAFKEDVIMQMSYTHYTKAAQPIHEGRIFGQCIYWQTSNGMTTGECPKDHYNSLFASLLKNPQNWEPFVSRGCEATTYAKEAAKAAGSAQASVDKIAPTQSEQFCMGIKLQPCTESKSVATIKDEICFAQCNSADAPTKSTTVVNEVCGPKCFLSEAPVQKTVTKHSKYVTDMLAMMVDSTTGSINSRMVKHFESSFALPCCKEPIGAWTGSNRQKCSIVLKSKADSQFLKGSDDAELTADNAVLGGLVCQLLFEQHDGSLCKDLPGKMCPVDVA